MSANTEGTFGVKQPQLLDKTSRLKMFLRPPLEAQQNALQHRKAANIYQAMGSQKATPTAADNGSRFIEASEKPHADSASLVYFPFFKAKFPQAH